MRVLIIVEPSINEMVAGALFESGHDVTTADDPVDAVGQFITHPFDMFLCDLRQDETGIEVAGTMKRMDGGASLRVVFIAKDRAHADRITNTAEGSFDITAILRDPVTTEDLQSLATKAAPSKKVRERKDRPLTPKERQRKMVVKLRRELERVEEAESWQVLRLEEGYDRSDVEEARRRLKRRYLKIVKNSSLPDDARQMAAALQQYVEHAYIELVSARRGDRRRKVVTDEERLIKYLEHARELVESHEWDKADKLLASARLIQQDHPKVLVLQGWARLHNPGLEKEKREEHGKDLMMMGEQFDPYDFEVAYFLAQFYQMQGDHDGAWRRVVRACRADGEHQGAKNLYNKIKKAGGKGLEDEDTIQ